MHAETVHAALGRLAQLQREFAVQPQAGQAVRKILRLHAQMEQGRQIHVAADAGKAVIVENAHSRSVLAGQKNST